MNNSLEQENNFLKQSIKIYMKGCEERQNKIDKAIEYIEKEIYYCLSSGDNIYLYLDKLLEILGDK